MKKTNEIKQGANSGRDQVLASASDYFEEGGFVEDLSRLVAVPTESQRPESRHILKEYLTDILEPEFKQMGFSCELVPEMQDRQGPSLIAERIESPDYVTVLLYGHGDVVDGYAEQWSDGLDPWKVEIRDGAFYGRGTADNKGQHWINISALRTVLEQKGELGFNCKFLIEMGEEVGSPGLTHFCETYKERLQADFLIASDGPRIVKEKPSVILGSRGSILFDLTVDLQRMAKHSGNWGGIIKDPGIILSQALATITNEKGEIRIPEWLPNSLTPDISQLINKEIGSDDLPNGEIDHEWGQSGLTPAERLIGWNCFSILAFNLGNPLNPVNAIPGKAIAHCQLRFVVDTDVDNVLPALREHFDLLGFEDVEISMRRKRYTQATRMSPTNSWAQWAVKSIEKSLGTPPNLIPNIGGTVPNHNFSEVLGMTTIWIPHSYSGCSQHAPNEHLPLKIACEGLQLMSGLFWDLAEVKRHQKMD